MFDSVEYLRRMSPPKPIDIGLARELADKVKAEPKMCWRNSLRAFLVYRWDNPDLVDRLRYVEGVLYLRVDGERVIPIDHGWLEIEGRVVDVTLYADGYEPEDYRPVFRYEFTVLRSMILENPALPICARDRNAHKNLHMHVLEMLAEHATDFV